MADGEREEAEISIEEAMELAVTKMVELTRTLAKTGVPDNRGWFRNMLVGILISTHSNYQAVKAGIPKGPALTCWGARNLLELRVITTYVLRSVDEATDFMDDLAADNREFYENLQRSEEFTHKELIAEMRGYAESEPEPLRSILLRKTDEKEGAGPDVQGMAEEAENTRKMMAAFGVDPTRRPKHGRTIAELVEESERYGPRFKMLSKVVHPTSFSIAATMIRGGFDALLPIIQSQAQSDMLAILCAIEEHIKAHGIGWPEKS
jgi:hypothetical protein